ncbi:MAG TPA: DUF2130 domain-containing protein [Burkholderiaceae bacterium]|nr:DUF2130 domain-containing protein [Burkholderiaceae bacterium]
MSETTLKCPQCGHRFPLTEALAAQLRGEVEASLTQRHQQQMQALAQRLAQAEAAQREAQQRTEALAREREQALAQMREELETKLRAESEARLQQMLTQEAERVRGEVQLQLKQSEARAAELQLRLQQAQQAELALRQQAERIAERERALELEVARKLDEKRREWEDRVRQIVGEEQRLKLQEKDKTIEDLKRLLEEARRKSEQGSQELQGEVLELDIQTALATQFPRDVIRPVPKGVQGADLLHEVRDAALTPCGTIVWETKNTKHWQPAWIGKLKDDQRACGAAVAVLVTVALPPEARGGFALIDGVWVASLAAWPALAVALREQLLQVAFARNAATGMSEKMQALYDYLAGDAFRHRVEAIVEAFAAMKSELDRERRAMERIWKEREKQLERVLAATAGMYGELRGTIGQSMPTIAALELDTDPTSLPPWQP